jgi:hypothetical protein
MEGLVDTPKAVKCHGETAVQAVLHRQVQPREQDAAL